MAWKPLKYASAHALVVSEGIVVHGLGYATSRGLSDAMVHSALGFIEETATQALTDQQKRAKVEAELAALFHLPTSVIQLIVAIAFQVYKAEKAGHVVPTPTGN
jgi:hypothetical protein